jgi:hypothetical protein
MGQVSARPGEDFKTDNRRVLMLTVNDLKSAHQALPLVSSSDCQLTAGSPPLNKDNKKASML